MVLYVKHQKDNFNFLGTENIVVHVSFDKNSARMEDAVL